MYNPQVIISLDLICHLPIAYQEKSNNSSLIWKSQTDWQTYRVMSWFTTNKLSNRDKRDRRERGRKDGRKKVREKRREGGKERLREGRNKWTKQQRRGKDSCNNWGLLFQMLTIWAPFFKNNIWKSMLFSTRWDDTLNILMFEGNVINKCHAWPVHISHPSDTQHKIYCYGTGLN